MDSSIVSKNQSTQLVCMQIPFVKLAQNLEPTLLLYGSPWTAPPWMKTNKAYTGRGMLQKQYFKVWANYIVKLVANNNSNVFPYLESCTNLLQLC